MSQGWNSINPPAINNLQAIKVRFPNTIDMVKPSAIDVDGYQYDDDEYPLLQLDPTMYGEQNVFQNPNFPTLNDITNPHQAYAEIPYQQISYDDEQFKGYWEV